MALVRSSGVLLHPTSLPGGHGCGDFGPGAFAFIDYLQDAGVRSWQVLPLGPTGKEGSPYQARSSFAGNPIMISLDKLVEAGLLEECGAYSDDNPYLVNFESCREYKNAKLREAFKNFAGSKCMSCAYESFDRFKRDQGDWLEDYAAFAGIKESFNDSAWWQWPDQKLLEYDRAAIDEWCAKNSEELEYQRWLQFVFYVQWGELKSEANKKGICIIGDIPIYAAHDSADVWGGRELFEVNPETGEAELMAGAPPDYFCEDGQLWGNPIYKWNKMKEDNYAWWLRRMDISLKLTDALRIDHFRGFEAYWQVDAGEQTAKNGKWVKCVGQDFFTALKKRFGSDLPLIAEDLGVITPEVDKLRLDNDLPGMKILQFAFCDGANQYRPHSYDKNCVVYTGTHDNDTTRGWYAAEGKDYEHMGRDIIDAERDLCRRYLAVDGSNIHWDMIRLALASPADTAIIPMQDILGLGNESRMNRPGIADGNWAWRMSWEQLENAERNYLREMNTIFDRINQGK